MSFGLCMCVDISVSTHHLEPDQGLPDQSLPRQSRAIPDRAEPSQTDQSQPDRSGPTQTEQSLPRQTRAYPDEGLPRRTRTYPDRPGPTQLGDAYLLQVLPGDVLDDGDGVVAVLTEPLLVLGQPDHTQPLPQLRLEPRKTGFKIKKHTVLKDTAVD